MAFPDGRAFARKTPASPLITARLSGPSSEGRLESWRVFRDAAVRGDPRVLIEEAGGHFANEAGPEGCAVTADARDRRSEWNARQPPTHARSRGRPRAARGTFGVRNCNMGVASQARSVAGRDTAGIGTKRIRPGRRPPRRSTLRSSQERVRRRAAGPRGRRSRRRRARSPRAPYRVAVAAACRVADIKNGFGRACAPAPGLSESASMDRHR